MHEHRHIYSTDILNNQVSVFGHFSESRRSLETLLANQIIFLKNAQDGS